ncbi:MAG: asparagine synthase (glutamine-hydrolyzing) [Anaerolineae bacterium]|nr:asparagine synthase (glutamine-hydrolyzing) [Anaerolineae bacterium]
MCGIIGVLNLAESLPTSLSIMRRMLGTIRHRGPDEFGIYRDRDLAMASARLSIIDLGSGQQPICNEDRTLWIVFNGEVFNYLELRKMLQERGHLFSTNSDTEVIVHLYEEYGPGCLEWLNGQFAIAIWDTRSRRLFLARDRVGIRPLFYTVVGKQLIFGSEIKALLAYPAVNATIDQMALRQVFTYWSTLSPRTIFAGIQDLPPGTYLLADEHKLETNTYWALDFSEPPPRSVLAKEAIEQFEQLLIDAVELRLRADVRVGAYLSGGLDSSVVAAIVRKQTDNRLETFSISFDDPAFDESRYQRQMCALLGTDHHIVSCSTSEIGLVFPDVIWHTEVPILRTSPAPMFLLSRLVHDNNLKVVLTGEGADETLGGYNIFKEMQVRRFWARNPESTFRPLLLQRLYPYIDDLKKSSSAYLASFFRQNLSDTASPYYSHLLRWKTTSRLCRFLQQGKGDAPRGDAEIEPLPALPPRFETWSHLAQAQYLEMTIFMSQYLLSSQGDRMAMAHSVEGRFPFLDHRVIEFCNALPQRYKLAGLTEKWLLKQLGKKLVPSEIWNRPKQPYRAPIHRSFFHPTAPDYVADLLSESALRDSGVFDVTAVSLLKTKTERAMKLSETDSMALVGILSTQLIHHQFVRNFQAQSLRPSDPIRVVDALSSSESEATKGHFWSYLDAVTIEHVPIAPKPTILGTRA